ncbi:Protein SOSEKI 1 [Microbotryomycetes sp. JL201]|nr:Protein SOSEKI 1 [Microbotryomycetes sp. JL201]
MEASHSVAHHDAGAHSSALGGGSAGASASQHHAKDSSTQDSSAHDFNYSVAVSSQYSSHAQTSDVAESRSPGSGSSDNQAQWIASQEACMHSLATSSSSSSPTTTSAAPQAGDAQTMRSTYLARSGPVAPEPASRDDNDSVAPAQIQERRRSVQDLVSECMHVGTSTAVDGVSAPEQPCSSASRRHSRRWSGIVYDPSAGTNATRLRSDRKYRPTSRATSYSLPGSPSPPSHFVATHLRYRSQALRRRATSLPPPARLSADSPPPPNEAKSAFMDSSSSPRDPKQLVRDMVPSASARSQSPSFAPCTSVWHHRQRREERLLLASSMTGKDDRRRPRVLSQGDLLAHHAVRTLKKGSRVIITPTSLSPPITKATLRELDLTEILRNPQLRHDSVFDPNLMFRPNYDGERGDRKRELASQYWIAVARELNNRCRCTTFLDGVVLPCICSTSTLGASRLFDRLPSRIAPLVHELRAIVLSLLPSPTSSTPVWSTSSLSSSSSNFVTRDQIFETLDPAFISQQLTRGVLDVGNLATFLGRTLKMHCAPMRDALVDEMVESCTGDNVVGGLRLCFEILELMKLDVANHQLRTLRPYLVQTALDFEQRFFNDVVLQRSSPAIRPSLATATQWLSKSISAAHLTSSTTSWGAVPAVVREGVLSLVFETSILPETFQLDAYRLSAFHSDVTDLTCVYLLLSLFKQLAAPANPTELQLDDMRREIWCILASVNHAASDESSQASPTGAVTGLAKLDTSAWKASVQDAGLQLAARAHSIKTGSVSTPDKQTLAVVKSYISTHLNTNSKVFQLLQARLKATLSCVIQEELATEDNRTWWLSSTEIPIPTPINGDQSAPTPGSRKSCASRPISLMVDPTIVAITPSRSLKRQLDTQQPDHSGKKIKTKAGTPAPARSVNALAAADFESLLIKNGLTPLKNEVKVLGQRIARVTSFHLAVYREWYAKILTSLRE